MLTSSLSSTERTLLTTAEVAAVLRVSSRTVCRLGIAGDLERIKLGHRSLRYTEESVEALIRRSNDDERLAGRSIAMAGGTRDANHATP